MKRKLFIILSILVIANGFLSLMFITYNTYLLYTPKDLQGNRLLPFWEAWLYGITGNLWNLLSVLIALIIGIILLWRLSPK